MQLLSLGHVSMVNHTNMNSNLSANSGIQGPNLMQPKPKIVKFMLPSFLMLAILDYSLHLLNIFSVQMV